MRNGMKDIKSRSCPDSVALGPLSGPDWVNEWTNNRFYKRMISTAEICAFYSFINFKIGGLFLVYFDSIRFRSQLGVNLPHSCASASAPLLEGNLFWLRIRLIGTKCHRTSLCTFMARVRQTPNFMAGQPLLWSVIWQTLILSLCR